jgi:hypothetical protein
VKKSEAVKLVQTMVEHYIVAKGTVLITPNQFATAIINTLQDCGMTPPIHDSHPGSDWTVNSREWEREDA